MLVHSYLDMLSYNKHNGTKIHFSKFILGSRPLCPPSINSIHSECHLQQEQDCEHCWKLASDAQHVDFVLLLTCTASNSLAEYLSATTGRKHKIYTKPVSSSESECAAVLIANIPAINVTEWPARERCQRRRGLEQQEWMSARGKVKSFDWRRVDCWEGLQRWEQSFTACPCLCCMLRRHTRGLLQRSRPRCLPRCAEQNEEMGGRSEMWF